MASECKDDAGAFVAEQRESEVYTIGRYMNRGGEPQPPENLEWAARAMGITPADSYDAAIYIDTVTPPGK